MSKLTVEIDYIKVAIYIKSLRYFLKQLKKEGHVSKYFQKIDRVMVKLSGELDFPFLQYGRTFVMAEQKNDPKLIFQSKTFWVNVLALAGMIYQGRTGNNVMSPEVQAGALSVINIILRAITKKPVKWIK